MNARGQADISGNVFAGGCAVDGGGQSTERTGLLPQFRRSAGAGLTPERIRQCVALGPRNDGAASLIPRLARLIMLTPAIGMLFGCGPNYSPDTYANNAAQQAAKVEAGVIAGVRPIQISAQGTAGGVAGAAAGGVAGSQVGAGPTSAFGAIGGSLIGGIAGVATEHIIGDTDGFEYVVRKANGDMISVAQ